MLMVPWHILTMFCVHWIITKVGFLFIEAEVLRKGNEQLLDGLEEGVIIVEEQSKDILFYNTAAALAWLGKQCDKSERILATYVKPELKAMAQKIDEERFAKIDKSMFVATNADTGLVIKKLQKSNQYISMQEIITQVTRDNVSLKKQLFKIRPQL